MVGYFKCTHVGCGSRKKVWRQANGAEVVERDGTHAHVAPGGRYEYVGEVSMHDDEVDEVPVPVNVAARGGAGRATGILEGGLDTSVRRAEGTSRGRRGRLRNRRHRRRHGNRKVMISSRTCDGSKM